MSMIQGEKSHLTLSSSLSGSQTVRQQLLKYANMYSSLGHNCIPCGTPVQETWKCPFGDKNQDLDGYISFFWGCVAELE